MLKLQPVPQAEFVYSTLGQLSYIDEDYSKALYYYTKQYKTQGCNKFNCLKAICKCFLKQSDSKNTLITLKQIKDLGMDSIEALIFCGKMYYRLAHYKEARVLFDVALFKDNQNP